MLRLFELRIHHSLFIQIRTNFGVGCELRVRHGYDQACARDLVREEFEAIDSKFPLLNKLRVFFLSFFARLCLIYSTSECLE